MNIQHIQTNVARAGSLYQTKLANSERHHETSSIKNEQVTISKEGLAKYSASLKFNKISGNDPMIQHFQQFYEEYNSAEAIEQRRLEQLEKEQAYNPLTDEFNLLVKGNFPENTLHHSINEVLEGKVKNASLYAAELASAIRSSISMSDKSVEERTAYREMALKQAEYVAENYFDNKEEATSFMNEINKYYENDLLREKGYAVIDNSDLEPFRKYSSPLSNGNDASFYTLAKKYMDEDYFERFINGEGTAKESAKFLMQLENNKEKYRKEITEEFEFNEQQVEALVKDVKSMFESFVWEKGHITGTTGEELDYFDELINWNKNMLSLFL